MACQLADRDITDSKPSLAALAAGGSECAWGSFLDELRGLAPRPPLLVISDGAAGLIGAAGSVQARSLRQKCLIHRPRNMLAKFRAAAEQEIRDAYWAIFDTDDLTAADTWPGPGSSPRDSRIDAFAQTYGKIYAAAVR